MIAQIVANVHLLDLPVLILALDENVLEEIIIMLLHFLIGHIGDHWNL